MKLLLAPDSDSFEGNKILLFCFTNILVGRPEKKPTQSPNVRRGVKSCLSHILKRSHFVDEDHRENRVELSKIVIVSSPQ
jgi:hypothetical protein